MAASALLHSLVHNHPFHNGNKRTANVRGTEMDTPFVEESWD
jgi:prophage maintenance system killer protein